MRPLPTLLAAPLLVCAVAARPSRAEDPTPPAARDPAAAPVPAPAPEPAPPHPLEGLWDLRIERNRWSPHRVTGTLAVSRGPRGLTGSITLDPYASIHPMPVEVEPADGNRASFSVTRGGTKLLYVEGSVLDGILTGAADWGTAEPREVSPLAAERVGTVRRFEGDAPDTAFPREPDPRRVGVDPAALDRLILYAGRCDTDALVVVRQRRAFAQDELPEGEVARAGFHGIRELAQGLLVR